MRHALRARQGNRLGIRATFIRFGSRITAGGPVGTVLLRDVTDETGHSITDHVWLSDDTTFRVPGLALQPGDRVYFVAKVEMYERRSGREYGLRRAVYVRKLKEQS